MEKKISSLDLIPTAPNAWIWRDTDGGREFLPSATIPAKDESLWHECTDADKAAYEAAMAEQHPEESPEVEDDWVNDTGDPATDPILSPSILEEGSV